MASERSVPDEPWQPATARPGELYTVEGRSRATWVALSGIRRRDPRGRAYRRQMAGVGALLLVSIVVIVVITAVA